MIREQSVLKFTRHTSAFKTQLILFFVEFYLWFSSLLKLHDIWHLLCGLLFSIFVLLIRNHPFSRAIGFLIYNTSIKHWDHGCCEPTLKHTHTHTSSTTEPYSKNIKDTYLPLPAMHCDWLLHPSSCVPHTHTHPHQVCFAFHVQFAERRGSRWVIASCGTEGPLDPSRPALRLCTIPPSGSDAPQPYSWG